MLGVDRAADRPERALLALDPDHDALRRARVVDPVDDPLGEAALGRLPPHAVKDTIAADGAHSAACCARRSAFLFARSSTEERVAAYVIREHARGRRLSEILDDRYVQNRLTPQQRLRLLDRPEVIQALGDETVATARASSKRSRTI